MNKILLLDFAKWIVLMANNRLNATVVLKRGFKRYSNTASTSDATGATRHDNQLVLNVFVVLPNAMLTSEILHRTCARI